MAGKILNCCESALDCGLKPKLAGGTGASDAPPAVMAAATVEALTAVCELLFPAEVGPLPTTTVANEDVEPEPGAPLLMLPVVVLPLLVV